MCTTSETCLKKMLNKNVHKQQEWWPHVHIQALAERYSNIAERTRIKEHNRDPGAFRSLSLVRAFPMILMNNTSTRPPVVTKFATSQRLSKQYIGGT